MSEVDYDVIFRTTTAAQLRPFHTGSAGSAGSELAASWQAALARVVRLQLAGLCWLCYGPWNTENGER